RLPRNEAGSKKRGATMEPTATIRDRRSSGRYGIMASLEDISYSVLRRYAIGAEVAAKAAEKRCRGRHTTRTQFHSIRPPAHSATVVIRLSRTAIQASTQH